MSIRLDPEGNETAALFDCPSKPLSARRRRGDGRYKPPAFSSTAFRRRFSPPHFQATAFQAVVVDFAGSLAGKRVLYECDTLDREMRENGERHERVSYFSRAFAAFVI